jgi:hypothetical protein
MKYGREKAIEMYREYIMNKPELLELIPTELKDKTLGCWCKPKACHGDVLVKLADKN